MFTIERTKTPDLSNSASSPLPSGTSGAPSTAAPVHHALRSQRVQPTHHASPFQLPPSLDPSSKLNHMPPPLCADSAGAKGAETTTVLPDNGVASSCPGPDPSTRIPTAADHIRPPSAAAERSARVVQALLKDGEPLREPDADLHSGEVARTSLEADRIVRVHSATLPSDNSPPVPTRQDPTLPVASFTVEDADAVQDAEPRKACSSTDNCAAPTAHHSQGDRSKKPTSRSKTMRRVRFVSLSRKRREKQMECGKRVTDAMQNMDRDALTKLLADSRLIRSNSKAPETVLRNIAQGVFLPDGSSGC